MERRLVTSEAQTWWLQTLTDREREELAVKDRRSDEQRV